MDRASIIPFFKVSHTLSATVGAFSYLLVVLLNQILDQLVICNIWQGYMVCFLVVLVELDYCIK
jgi:hypothetical protein